MDLIVALLVLCHSARSFLSLGAAQEAMHCIYPFCVWRCYRRAGCRWYFFMVPRETVPSHRGDVLNPRADSSMSLGKIVFMVGCCARSEPLHLPPLRIALFSSCRVRVLLRPFSLYFCSCVSRCCARCRAKQSEVSIAMDFIVALVVLQYITRQDCFYRRVGCRCYFVHSPCICVAATDVPRKK